LQTQSGFKSGYGSESGWKSGKKFRLESELRLGSTSVLGRSQLEGQGWCPGRDRVQGQSQGWNTCLRPASVSQSGPRTRSQILIQIYGTSAIVEPLIVD